MTFKIASRVWQTSATTGTGTLSLDASSNPTGYRKFVDAIGNANTCPYVIDDGQGNWEEGIGTVTSGTPDTLARTTVINNSLGTTAKITFLTGTKTVQVCPIGSRAWWWNSAPTTDQIGIASSSGGMDPISIAAYFKKLLTTDGDVAQNIGGTVQRQTMAQLGTTLFPAWTTPSYSSGNFTASGSMTWTVDSGDVLTYSCFVIGKTMFLTVYLSATSVGGTLSNSLRIAIPGGYTAAGTVLGTCFLRDNGTAAFGQFYTGAAGATVITVQKADASNFSTSTNNTVVSGSLTFPIQ